MVYVGVAGLAHGLNSDVTKGITDEVRDSIPAANRMRLAMQDSSRSLNLSNTVAIVVYEAWRQNGLEGGQ